MATKHPDNSWTGIVAIAGGVIGDGGGAIAERVEGGDLAAEVIVNIGCDAAELIDGCLGAAEGVVDSDGGAERIDGSESNPRWCSSRRQEKKLASLR